MKYFYILLISIACFALTGCGGGGGGDNGVTLTPQQQEFADVIYAFATAINNKDKDTAKSFIMADVVYNKTNGYKEFKDRLENFIDNAENINFQINDIGVELELLDSYDELAKIRANVSFSYNNNAATNEILEINVEKSGTGENNKGIILFRKYSNDISAFPPVLE